MKKKDKKNLFKKKINKDINYEYMVSLIIFKKKKPVTNKEVYICDGILYEVDGK